MVLFAHGTTVAEACRHHILHKELHSVFNIWACSDQTCWLTFLLVVLLGVPSWNLFHRSALSTWRGASCGLLGPGLD